jgi:hypothetical protein
MSHDQISRFFLVPRSLPERSLGIVVGRFQHEGLLDHKSGNGLKQYFRWDFEV